MKATDLRVTNFVLNDGIVNTVIFIGYDAVMLVTPQGNQIQASLDRIQPIPLTPERLVKLGFEKLRRDIEMYVAYVEINCFMIKHAKGRWIVSEMRDVKYIHEVQNMFYFKMGQELEIK